MNHLRLALLLVAIGAAGGCHIAGERAHVPDDAETDAEGTPDDSGKVDARPDDAGDAGADADQG